jgi:protein associated with RNAse G/E
MTDLTTPSRIRVLSTRYDGSPRDEWPAQLLEQKETLLCLRVLAGEEEIVEGRYRQSIADSFLALYWTDRWYNVWRFDRSEGVVCYANVAMPCQFDGSVLRWTDLDIDVVQYADGSTVVRDEQEFRERSVRLGYPAEMIRCALAARDELLRLAKAGEFPFAREGKPRRG